MFIGRGTKGEGVATRKPLTPTPPEEEGVAFA